MKSEKLLNYWFLNEKSNTVTVIAIVKEWCVVEEENKKKPYLLEKEYVLAIYNESSQVNSETELPDNCNISVVSNSVCSAKITKCSKQKTITLCTSNDMCGFKTTNC